MVKVFSFFIVLLGSVVAQAETAKERVQSFLHDIQKMKEYYSSDLNRAKQYEKKVEKHMAYFEALDPHKRYNLSDKAKRLEASFRYSRWYKENKARRNTGRDEFSDAEDALIDALEGIAEEND